MNIDDTQHISLRLFASNAGSCGLIRGEQARLAALSVCRVWVHKVAVVATRLATTCASGLGYLHVMWSILCLAIAIALNILDVLS